MVAKVGSAVVEMRTDHAKLVQGVNTVNRKLQGFQKSIGKLTGSLAILGGAAGFGMVVKKSLETADAIGKAADTVALGVEQYQELAQSAERAGIAQSQFTSNMTAFVKRVGEARSNTGPLVSFLKKYDTGLLSAIQNTKTQEEAFNLMADAIKNAKTETDRAALANAAFSRAGVQMTILMKDGSDGVEQMRQRVRDLGTVLSEDAVRNAEAANDRFDELGRVLSRKVTKAVVDNADALEELATSMIKLTTLVLGGTKAWSKFWDEALQEEPVGSMTEQLKQMELQLDKLKGDKRASEGILGFLFNDPQADVKIGVLEQKIRELKDTMAQTAGPQLPESVIPKAEPTAPVSTVPEEDPAIKKQMERQAAAAEKRKEYLAQQLENVTQFLSDEETLETDAWFRRQEILDMNLENKTLTEEQHRRLTEELEAKHLDNLLQIRSRHLTQLQKFNAKSWDGQVKDVVGSMARMTQGVAQSSRAMFELNKAAGTANAIINTYTGVTQALAAYPPPLSFIMAGAQLAAGIAQVSAIQSTSFGSGGSAPSLAGLGGGSSTVNTTPVSNVANAQETAKTEVNITLNGTGYNKEDVRELIDSINDEIGDNVRLRAS